MATTLNRRSYEYAQKLIDERRTVLDDRDAWSEHRPTADQENKFIEKDGFEEYEKWHLGIDEEQSENTKARYTFPYGDFEDVHRCGVLSAEVRAAQYDHHDIQVAAAHLHGLLDGSS
jgi:hypothetical protein